MRNVAWITLEEEDNAEELFWSYFLQSFYRSKWVPEELKQRAASAFSGENAVNRLLLITFINDLADFGEPVMMVFDNFGVIQNQEILDKLEYLIRHFPANVHLVFSGREKCKIRFAKQEETISFFRSARQINLSG